jgi:hypothetical protein
MGTISQQEPIGSMQTKIVIGLTMIGPFILVIKNKKHSFYCGGQNETKADYNL